MFNMQKIEVVINYKSEDILRIHTDLVDPWDMNEMIFFERSVPKNKGVEYVYANIIPKLTPHEKKNIEIEVIDVKIKKLHYPIEFDREE